MQTHSPLKAFVCARCQKGFALKSYLNKHLESSACARAVGDPNDDRQEEDGELASDDGETMKVSVTQQYRRSVDEESHSVEADHLSEISENEAVKVANKASESEQSPDDRTKSKQRQENCELDVEVNPQTPPLSSPNTDPCGIEEPFF